MKLTAASAARFFSAPQEAAALLLYGPDQGRVRQYRQQIIATLLDDPSDPFRLVTLEAETLQADPARLADECHAMSLMGGLRVIWLRDPPDTLAKELETLLAAPLPDTFLLLTAGELPPRSALRKLFEQQSHLAALPCYADEARDLAGFARRVLEENGQTIDSAALSYLCSQLGNDRDVSLQEIRKLSCYALPETQISADMVRQCIGHNRDTTLDDLCLAFSGGDMAACRASFDRLILSGTASFAIIRALQRHLHQFWQLHAKQAQGLPVTQAMQQLKPPIFYKYRPAVERQLSAWPVARLARALASLTAFERQLKSSTPCGDLQLAHLLQTLHSQA